MKVRIVNFGGKEWIGDLISTTHNNMSIVRDSSNRDWAIPNQSVVDARPLSIGDDVKSLLGDGRFVIVATEVDTSTGELLYICRSTHSESSWNSRKK